MTQDITIPNSPSRMGRPPLKMKPTTIRLPKEVMEKIDGLVGEKRRVVFIREAIDEKLARENPQTKDE